jgi:hypothetical protein
MEYDKVKVDEMALALLYLISFRERNDELFRAWKSLDWDILDRLHEKGYIFDPKNKNKSVVFSDEGFKMSENLFKKHFGKL